MWWVHVFLAFTFIAVMPFTKLWHILAGLLNFFVRNFAPSQARMVENIEEAETFGVENIEEFTWKTCWIWMPASDAGAARMYARPSIRESL